MGSASSGNESDVYLASFARDLEFNFDGREINDMLANFNVPDGEGTDILHDQPFSGNLSVFSSFFAVRKFDLCLSLMFIG